MCYSHRCGRFQLVLVCSLGALHRLHLSVHGLQTSWESQLCFRRSKLYLHLVKRWPGISLFLYVALTIWILLVGPVQHPTGPSCLLVLFGCYQSWTWEEGSGRSLSPLVDWRRSLWRLLACVATLTILETLKSACVASNHKHPKVLFLCSDFMYRLVSIAPKSRTHWFGEHSAVCPVTGSS